jgi:recombination protein RecT
MSQAVAKFSNWLTDHGERVQREMPENYTIEKVKRLALHLQAQSDQLKNCTPESLYLGILKAAHFDLAIDLGEAHLVPYGREANFQIDYKGLIKLAKRSGHVKHIKADVVRDGDSIEYRRGSSRDDRYLVHEPVPFNEGKIIGAYALFDMADGYTEFEILSPGDAAAIRKKAAGGSMMWKDFESEAWKKAVIRRGIKTLELMPDDKRAVLEDDRQEYDLGKVDASPAARLTRRFLPKTPSPSPRQIDAEVAEPPKKTPPKKAAPKEAETWNQDYSHYTAWKEAAAALRSLIESAGFDAVPVMAGVAKKVGRAAIEHLEPSEVDEAVFELGAMDKDALSNALKSHEARGIA